MYSVRYNGSHTLGRDLYLPLHACSFCIGTARITFPSRPCLLYVWRFAFSPQHLCVTNPRQRNSSPHRIAHHHIPVLERFFDTHPILSPLLSLLALKPTLRERLTLVHIAPKVHLDTSCHDFLPPRTHPRPVSLGRPSPSGHPHQQELPTQRRHLHNHLHQYQSPSDGLDRHSPRFCQYQFLLRLCRLGLDLRIAILHRHCRQGQCPIYRWNCTPRRFLSSRLGPGRRWHGALVRLCRLEPLLGQDDLCAECSDGAHSGRKTRHPTRGATGTRGDEQFRRAGSYQCRAR